MATAKPDTPSTAQPSTVDDLPEFDLAGPLPIGMTVLEASAGTGKTYALTALVARCVAEGTVTIDQVLMVTFTRAAATEMKDRVRLRLFDLQRHLSGAADLGEPWVQAVADCTDAERAARLTRVTAALSGIDGAAITTIHGFCQQMIREMGVAGGDIALGEVSEGDTSVIDQQVRDGLLRTLAEAPDHFGPLSAKTTPRKIEERLVSVLQRHAANAGSVLAPVAGSNPDKVEADRWAAFVRDAYARIEQMRIASGRLSFDDLISGMRQIARQRSVASRARSQYRLVLIDEFQDTDAAQWNIFEQLFLDDPSAGESPTVVCVGDPKQAIYRFRGADIAAYLAATSRPGAVKLKLATNWRTDRPLVEAMNVLMHSMSLGDDIRYVQVTAAAQQRESALLGGGAPFQVRWVERGDDDVTAPVARPAIAIDLVNHVVELLAKGRLRRKDGEVPVKPGDIAVLVRSHRDAEPVIDALRRRGIPAVRSRLGAVTDTDAMAQLQVLAAAIANPANASLVRALVLTWFVDVAHVDVLSDPVVEALQVRCARWGAILQQGGAAALSAALRTDVEVLSALARAELERRLTDLEHLLELVQSETRGAPMSPSHLLRVLRSLADDDHSDPEARTRRTDTDADAVQITTMHSSKGLEYPIVLLPFPKKPTVDQPYVYSIANDEGVKVRYIDAAPHVEWAIAGLDAKRRKELAGAEIEADELRLMYVALTRAKHQVIMWWAPTDGAEKGPTAKVLFRLPDGTASAPSDDDGTEAAFAGLAQRIGSACSVRSFSVMIGPSKERVPTPAALGELAVAAFDRDELQRTDWYRWSFSSMMRADAVPTPLREHGGADESEREQAAAATGSTFTSHLLAMPASNHFGTLVHELYEAVDFASPTLDDDLAALIAGDARVAALGIDPHVFRRGLVDVVRTPLTGLYDGVPLSAIGSADRLAELEFHFPILDTDAPLARNAIARLAAEHIEGAIRDYFVEVGTRWSDEQLRGLMTGSIDSVLRVDGRYTVIDYKSNRVHPKPDPGQHAVDGSVADAHYSGAALLAQMASHDYLMQALLYSVALHRFLAERLPGYDPEVHHGGAGYLFVRGMSGADTPVIDGVVRGLSVWRPPTALLDALDRLFARREVAA